VSLSGSEINVSCGTEDSTLLMLSGEAGLSYCADPTAPCPFYLGSLNLQNTATTPVEVACADGTTEAASLQGVTIELTQPAFGVQDGSAVQFGTGALVLRTDVTVDGQTYGARRPNAAAVTMSGSAGSLDPDPFIVQFEVPCGTSTGQLRLAVDLDTSATLEEPPTASLNLPGSVTCGNAVLLSGTFGDPDGDLAQVQWYVDDVPLDASVQSVPIHETHVFRAVARDARGASTTAKATVTCS
jgi:hypothetical protein